MITDLTVIVNLGPCHDGDLHTFYTPSQPRVSTTPVRDGEALRLRQTGAKGPIAMILTALVSPPSRTGNSLPDAVASAGYA